MGVSSQNGAAAAAGTESKQPQHQQAQQAQQSQQPRTSSNNSKTDHTQETETPGILPASHWAPIEEEDREQFDGDSAFSEALSSTASLSSSILEYRTIHGRTYHSDIGKAEAWQPNDELHTESMDLHHHMCTLLLDGKLFLAPIKDDIKKVIDIGTGTGLWAIDFGDQFPNAEVIGTDVSPIQPSWVPPNVRFEIDDANLDWTFQDNSFDFIHVRCMLGTIADWPEFYREAYRCLKPGGWIEHHDEEPEWTTDDGLPEDSPMGQWYKVFTEGGKKFGRTFRLISEDVQRKGMEAAGFADIVVKDYKCPIGEWPRDPRQKEIGAFAKATLESDLEGYILYMWSAVMGWTPEEIKVYIAHLRRQMRDKTLPTWYPHRVVYARKPETAS